MLLLYFFLLFLIQLLACLIDFVQYMVHLHVHIPLLYAYVVHEVLMFGQIVYLLHLELGSVFAGSISAFL